MPKVTFHKYQATGNDFILIDNRENTFPKDDEVIQKLCDRRFGIGSDGLILIENNGSSDFNMVFYNPDASQSLCGNGCRGAIRFAENLSIVNSEVSFNAYDGLHSAQISDGIIELEMADVQNVSRIENGIFINTGSPHFVVFTENVDDIDIISEGRKLRYSGLFGEGGANINFVQVLEDSRIYVRTYERGVENETLSCGTGVTAAALATILEGHGKTNIGIKTKGGNLEVSAQHSGESFSEIWLKGPAEHVFTGEIAI